MYILLHNVLPCYLNCGNSAALKCFHINKPNTHNSFASRIFFPRSSSIHKKRKTKKLKIYIKTHREKHILYYIMCVSRAYGLCCHESLLHSLLKLSR